VRRFSRYVDLDLLTWKTNFKLHLDVDQGTETVESVLDPMAHVAGKRMRYMILNKDIARPTRNRYANHDFEFDCCSRRGRSDL
jgi:hypothetical protein